MTILVASRKRLKSTESDNMDYPIKSVLLNVSNYCHLFTEAVGLFDHNMHDCTQITFI